MHGLFERRQAGQAIVLVAAAVLVLTAILMLAIDGGGIYLERRQLQNAADAGALAGAENLWSSNPPGYVAMHSQALSTIGKNLNTSVAGISPTSSNPSSPQSPIQTSNATSVTWPIVSPRALRHGPGCSKWPPAPAW